MYEQQTESDDDCEVYFLKPVNEYNIAEKIKEANKELFADTGGLMGTSSETTSITVEKTQGTAITSTNLTINRKVTFAANLEDYEPDELDNMRSDAMGRAPYSSIDEAESDEMDDLQKKLKNNYHFPTIDEEEAAQTGNEAEVGARAQAKINEEKFADETLITTTTMVMNRISEIQEAMSSLNHDYNFQEGPADSNGDNTVVEEICEEIIVMDMEENPSESEALDGAANAVNGAGARKQLSQEQQRSQQLQRCIVKQATFDYDESDNRSLTNLITSDYDEDEDELSCNNAVASSPNDFGECYEDIYDDDVDNNSDMDISLRDHNLNRLQNDNEEEEEEDDRLSIIVASYLPEDFQHPKARLLDKASAKTKANQYKSKTNHSPLNFSRNKGSTTTTTSQPTNSNRKSPFGKGFTLRRKAHSTNSIGACVENDNSQKHGILNSFCSNQTHHHHYTTFGHQMKQSVSTTTMLVPDEITDLKLNYKTCCEYRNSVQEKLPKYTGYLSEYGLSRRQLEERDQKQQQKHRYALEKTLKANEQEMRRMQDNERAFTTWLKNKMRFPINKTRNMFDVKLGTGSSNNNNNSNNSSNSNNSNSGASAFRKRYFSSNKTK